MMRDFGYLYNGYLEQIFKSILRWQTARGSAIFELHVITSHRALRCRTSSQDRKILSTEVPNENETYRLLI